MVATRWNASVFAAIMKVSVAGAVPLTGDVSVTPVPVVEAVKLQSLPTPLTVTLPLPPLTPNVAFAGENENTHGGSS